MTHRDKIKSQQESKTVLKQFFKDAMNEPQDRGKLLLEKLKSLQSNDRYDRGGDFASGGMKKITLHNDEMILRKIVMATPLKNQQDYESVWDFIREARITAKVSHPNIVPIYEIGVNDQDLPYYTMKFIEGENLGAILSQLQKKDPGTTKSFPLKKLLSIYIKICEAMAFAHSKGVVHLDLKADNILVSDFGQVQVCDWGLAHELEHIKETLEPKLTGTPGYLSPEQICGNEISTASDIYSLGAVLYHSLTCSRPFENLSIDEILRATVKGESPFTYAKDIPNKIPLPLISIVNKAMKLNPTERYDSVDALLNDIESFLNDRPTLAASPGLARRFILMVKRHRTSALLFLTASFIITVVVAFYQIRVQEEVFMRREISVKAVEHYDIVAQQHLNSFQFKKALEAVKISLRYKESKKSHWIKTQIHMAQMQLDQALYHAQKCHPRLVEILDNMSPYKNLNEDDFSIKLLQELMKRGFPGIALNIMYLKNSTYQDLSAHLPFVERVLKKLNPGLDHYDLHVVDGMIIFKAGKGLSRLHPLVNLPVKKLVLNNSFVYELSSLKGMRSLRHLELKNTQVFEVPELVGMQLDYLDLSESLVYSFNELSQIYIRHLRIQGSHVLNLGLMKDHPTLETLEIDVDRYSRPHTKKHINYLKSQGIIAH
jgi:serine/threonine protein kinase